MTKTFLKQIQFVMTFESIDLNTFLEIIFNGKEVIISDDELARVEASFNFLTGFAKNKVI